MKYFIYGLLAVALVAGCTQAFAHDNHKSQGDGHDNKMTPRQQRQWQNQSQSQDQTQSSNSAANSVSTSNAQANSTSSNTNANSSYATGGNSQAAGGNAVSGQSTSITSQAGAPAVAQGALLIQGCGAGGNAGGSNTRGAAFAGVAWTPKECYAFMLAQAYQAVGQSQAACEVLKTTDAMKRAHDRGMPELVCAPPPVPVNVTYGYTREQVDEIVRKAVRK